MNNKIQKDQRSNCHFWRDRSTVHAPCTHHHHRGGQTIYATAPAGPLDTLPPSFHKRNQLAYPLGEQAIKGTCCLFSLLSAAAAAAAAKSLQSCPTLCDPIDGSPPGSPIPGILQGRTLEWVAISLSNAWKWKVKVKSLSSSRSQGLQPPRLLRPCDFPGKSTGVGCHRLLPLLQQESQ